MSKEQDSTQSAEDFKEMPKVDAFKALPGELQEQLLQKFSNEDHVENHSEPSKEPKEEEGEAKAKPDDKSKDTPKEEGESSESSEPKEDTQNQSPADEVLAQRYKNLEREFTRKSQALKELAATKEELLQRVAKLEGKLETTTPTKPEEASPDLAALKVLGKENPKIAALVEAIEKSMAAQAQQLQEQIKALEEKDKSRDEASKTKVADANFNSFSSSLQEFLEGPLKELEPELDSILVEEFGDEEGVEKAARASSELFESIKGKLFSKHFDKVKEVMAKASKAKETEEEAEKRRHEEIQNTGVSEESNTHREPDGAMSMKKYNSLSTSEKEAFLKKMGRVED